ncbi:MAG: hypothetical protein HGA93_02650 [Methanothrix sp.]|nr:hypothetical protein [Methanothrix sp.]
MALEFDTASELPEPNSHGTSCFTFGFRPCAASCPDRVLTRDILAGYCAGYSAQLFLAAEISVSPGAEDRMSATKARISWNKRFGFALGATACCPAVGATPKPVLAKQRIIGIGFCPRHARHPLHEAAN